MLWLGRNHNVFDILTKWNIIIVAILTIFFLYQCNVAIFFIYIYSLFLDRSVKIRSRYPHKLTVCNCCYSKVQLSNTHRIQQNTVALYFIDQNNFANQHGSWFYPRSSSRFFQAYSFFSYFQSFASSLQKKHLRFPIFIPFATKVVSWPFR